MAFLKDKLRPASFRGVPFQVDASEFETGRRLQVHEYPQRDTPFSQDLGRSTRRVEFDAFVIGADYVEKANALLGAVEEYGSGALIHPWFGSLTVNVFSCRVSFDRGLGVARFSLAFVEAGILSFPSSAQSTAALSRAAAEKLETASVNRFAAVFSVLRKINAVVTGVLVTYGKVLGFLQNPVFALSNRLGFGSLPGNLSSLAALAGVSINLGWNFAGLLNLSAKAKDGTLTGDDRQTVPLVRGLVRMATNSVLADPVAPTYTTASAWQQYQNDQAIYSNTRQLLLVQAVGLSSYINCSVYDDTLAVKNELAAALDAEALLVDDDDLYQALMSARSAMWDDLTQRSRNSARLISITPPDVLPMLVIAYDYYEDASRDLEIDDRNHIANPGFVAPAQLLVLSQ